MPEPEHAIGSADGAMNLNPDSRGVTGWIVLVCGAISAGIGALVLAGWSVGSHALTALGTDLRMVPNTALPFMLLGSAVLAREIWPASRGIHRAAAVAALLSVVVVGMTLLGFAIGLNINEWLSGAMRALGARPVGHMSAITAICLVLASVSLLLLERRARTWAAIAGVLIALTGAVCLIGYWFEAPLLYGKPETAVALPTSLALVALGAGLTAAAGPDTWPLNALIGPSTRARLLRALLPAVVLLALLDDWITVKLLEHSAPRIVLISAITAISFLLLVSYVITRISGAIGDAVDRAQAESKRAALALQEINERFLLALEVGNAGVWEWNLNRDEVYFDGRFHALLGYTPGELPTTIQEWKLYHHPEDLPVMTAKVEGYLRGDSPIYESEHRIRTKAGTWNWVFTRGKILDVTGKGSPERFIGIAMNVTERKRVEETLKNSIALLNEMGRIAAVGGWEFPLMAPNQAMTELKQVWTDEVYRIHEVDRDYSPTVSKGIEFYPPASRPIIERAVQDVIAEGKPFDFESEFITAKGNQRWVHAVGRVDRERGKVFGIFQDITERKHIEEALRKSEEQLRKALAERERLSRDLHDGVVQSIYAIGLGLEEIKRLVTVDAHGAKKKLLESIAGLNAVIRNLREHITGQAPDGLDRRGLRSELGALVAMANSTPGMQFDLEADPVAMSRLPPTAAYDLINIVREAVSNSLRHSGGRHGVVSLTLRDGAVRLAITDDGVGFDMLHLDGRGRGLPNIAARADDLAAQLDIRSSRGQGTCIIVDIPMERLEGDG